MMKHLIAAALLVATTNAATAADLAPVKLGINKLGAMTNVVFASKTGIFKKHGLDLQIIEIPLSSQGLLILKQGSVDIVLQIPGTAFVAKEQGFDVALIGQNETAGTKAPVSNAIMVPVDSTVKTIADLKGKRIAISSPRGQGFAAMKMLFQNAGIGIESAKLTEAPFTAITDLLRTGQVDAAVALDPYTTQIIKAGYGRVLSFYMMETIPDQPVGSWWAMRSWAKAHTKEAGEFADAIKESHDVLNADPERARKEIADYSGLDPALVKDMPPIQWKSQVDPKIWQALADMMYQQGELTQKHTVSEYFVN